MSKHRSKPQAKNKRKGKATSTPRYPIWLIALITVIVIGATIAFVSMNQSPDANPTNTLQTEISVTETLEKYEAGAFLLDVRTNEEWNAGHIPDTTLIPLNELQQRLNELPKDQEIVVVCRSGNRSAEGRDILRQAGFEQVTSMAGGVNEWKALGYPFTSGP